MSHTGKRNDLLDFFEHGAHRIIHKWMHYFEIYVRHFAPFRGLPITMLEIGVSHGGSLQMWKHYFGPQARIYGMDIDPRCSVLAEENVEIIIGDQSDRAFLRKLRHELPPFDIVLDDGGHGMEQLIVTFEELFPHVRDGGVYLAEDLHTCYMHDYEGGHRKAGTFIEYSKGIIDQLYAWCSQDASLTPNDLTRPLYAMHYYDSVLVLDKRTPVPQQARMRGTPSFPLSDLEKEVMARG